MKYLQSFSSSRFEVSSERSDSDCQNQFQFLYFDEVFQEQTNEKAVWPIQIDFQDPEFEIKILSVGFEVNSPKGCTWTSWTVL